MVPVRSVRRQVLQPGPPASAHPDGAPGAGSAQPVPVRTLRTQSSEGESEGVLVSPPKHQITAAFLLLCFMFFSVLQCVCVCL